MSKISFQLFSWPPIASHLCFLLLGLFASSEYWKSRKQTKSLNPVYEEANDIILKFPRKNLSTDFSSERTQNDNRDVIFVLNTKAGKVRCAFEEVRTSQWGMIGKDKMWVGFSKEKIRQLSFVLNRVISKNTSDWSLMTLDKPIRPCPRLIL